MHSDYADTNWMKGYVNFDETIHACNLDASILDDKIQSISHGWTLNAIFDQINEIKKIHFHQNCIPHILIDIQ